MPKKTPQNQQHSLIFEETTPVKSGHCTSRFLQQIVPGCVIRFILNLTAKIQTLKQTLEILKAKLNISYKVLPVLHA